MVVRLPCLDILGSDHFLSNLVLQLTASGTGNTQLVNKYKVVILPQKASFVYGYSAISEMIGKSEATCQFSP